MNVNKGMKLVSQNMLRYYQTQQTSIHKTITFCHFFYISLHISTLPAIVQELLYITNYVFISAGILFCNF